MSQESHPETSDSTTPTVDGPKRKGKVARKHTVGRVIVASTLALGLITGLGMVYFYRHLNDNIASQSLDKLGERPEKVYAGNGEPLNILVMGDDTRAGDDANKIDNETGGGSDTTILVHLSADRSRAYAISIPRDSIIDRPECGDSPAATDVMWNAAYSIGGPLCTAAQLEAMTGVYVDHYVVVDFNGFGDMVDAVGGVPVCVPEDLVDKAHQIFVPAGDPSLLSGDQALDYVRARYVGELIQQNDISRIRRQQTFIAALVREVQSAGTLTRPDRVVKFLDAATQSLETDDNLDSVAKIGRLALQLQDIGLEKVKFVTLPTEYFPRDSDFWGTVFWKPEAEEVFRLINEDKPLPPKLLRGSISAEPPSSSSESPAPTPTPTDTASPSVSPTPTPTPTPSSTPEPEPEPDPIPGVCA